MVSHVVVPGPLPPFRNEVYRDFSRSDERASFEAALEEVRRRLPMDVPLVIGGKRVETRERMEMECPSDLSLELGRSSLAGVEDVDRAIEVAKGAYRGWSRTFPERRAAVLLDLAQGIRERRDFFSAVAVIEAGKSWREADADVCEGIDFLEYYAREVLRMAGRTRLQPELLAERNELFYDSMGVVAVIGPWNFPLAIPVGMMAAAMVTGNTVLWKPAEQTPLITYLVMELMEKVGVPPGVVNLLPGRGEVAGQHMLESPDVAMVAFTGSREVGLHILKECNTVRTGQRHVKRVIAEMGGKNALIVDESADLDAAVPDIVHSAFGFSGQKCSACSRLIVVGGIHDELAKRLKEAMGRLKIAPSWDPACNVNALIDDDARRKTMKYLEIGRKEGTVLFCGDVGELGTQGFYVPHAAFTGIKPSHQLAREEVFGPVLAIMRAANFDEALEMANDSDYGLTGGVHSRSVEHLERAAREFRVGNLYLNRGITGAIVGRQPFGGFKLSGIGSKAGGPDYLKQFVVARTVSENAVRR
jgi:RHH-type transcriptional regulator, proline utilization regulon repressor / proline dehydrogenase / delta 1-pyrroline-5-carboxylate dehydrogenase